MSYSSLIRCFLFVSRTNPGRLTIDFLKWFGGVWGENLRSNNLFTKATDFKAV